MNISIEVKFLAQEKRQFPRYVCFRHAVEAAQRGESVNVEIDAYDGDYDMRDTSCKDCRQTITQR